MIRAASKNHDGVAVVVDPADYDGVLASLQGDGLNLDDRRRLAAKAYAHTASYDTAITKYLSKSLEVTYALLGERMLYAGSLVDRMRYGENPHQEAAFYIDQQAPAGSLATARQLQGKALSLQQHRRQRCGTRVREAVRDPGLRHRQACKSLRRRCRRRHPRSLRQGIQDRPDVRIRRHHRVQPAAGCEDRSRHHRAAICRGDRRADDRLRRGRCLQREEERARARDGRLGYIATTPGFDFKKVSGGLLVQNTDLGKDHGRRSQDRH